MRARDAGKPILIAFVVIIAIVAVVAFVMWVASAIDEPAKWESVEDVPPLGWLFIGAMLFLMFRGDGDRKITLGYDEREILRRIASALERIASKLP